MGRKKSRFRKQLLFIFSLFFMLMIFLIGVEVGQRFSGISLKGQKRADEKPYLATNERGDTEVKEVLDNFSEEVVPEPNITFYDDLQKESKNENVIATKPNSSEHNVRPKESVKKENSVPSSEDAKPNLLPSKYALQLGSYKVRSQAEELKSELEKKGYSAYILEANIPEKGIWYRVKIGDYEDLEQVRQAAVDLQKNEGKSAIVTGVSR